MKSMTDNWSEPSPLEALAANESLYLNAADFKLARGAAKGDAAAQLSKSGAREAMRDDSLAEPARSRRASKGDEVVHTKSYIRSTAGAALTFIPRRFSSSTSA
jgi:hypothetical protein